jgi:hypothetical protein
MEARLVAFYVCGILLRVSLPRVNLDAERSGRKTSQASPPRHNGACCLLNVLFRERVSRSGMAK